MFKPKPHHRHGADVDTLIGAGVVIRGDVVFSGGLYVEGRIEGKVMAEPGQPGLLIVAEKGGITGEVHVPTVVIDGQLHGDVHSSERVELAPKARVQGNVHYKVVEMSAGATLTGRLIHADAASAETTPLTVVRVEAGG
ncbi:MAG: polymer-forming cytoskeletal protein [Pseudoxanthomonas sp.]